MGRPPRPLTPEASVRHRFGAELRHWRTARHLTQHALAAAVHYSPETIAKVEKAQRWPSAELARCADAVLDTGGALMRIWPGVEYQRLASDRRRRSLADARRTPARDP